jgi:hypothetical protein
MEPTVTAGDNNTSKKRKRALQLYTRAVLQGFKHEMTDQSQMERRRRRSTSLYAKCIEIQN